ncbi:MAG TPA: hypothetical protein VMU15_18700 [Anaeromyxobacter sp.]|nr:hypothetical protein [Anaeromyxobacter sp.]
MIPVGPALALLLAAGPKYAVMPVVANEVVSEKSASLLTETLAAELRQQTGGDVVTPRDLGNALSLEKQKQMLGCQSDSCMAEIAGAFGADQLLVGDVAQLGESLLAQIRLLDAHKSKVIAQTRRRFRRGGLDDLLDALPSMIAELLSAQPMAAIKPTPAPAPPAQEGARKEPVAERAPAEKKGAAQEPAETGKKAGAGTVPGLRFVSTARQLADGAWEIDLAVPLAASGVMPVSLGAGPVTVTELRVRNMPSEEETHDQSRGNDKSHPKPTVTVKNGGSGKVKCKLKVALEDDQGKPLMTCDASKGVDQGETSELNLCWIASIRTLDWPKLRAFHVTGTIKKD